MKRPGFLLFTLTLVVAGIYLFVNAPPALPETTDADPGAAIPIEKVFETIAAENDVVRGLYTQEIVSKGQLAGLRFQEEWAEQGVDAGPLPALFLREAAASLQRAPMPVGLFLGSDFPISAANRFSGRQGEVFERIKATRAPEYFYAEDTGQYTAMFPDVAGVQGCVTCHNEHKDSPKTDWVVGDVMGAATWSFDRASVSPAEYLQIIGSVRASFRAAYSAYLDKAASFAAPPEVGERWPADGYFVPSADIFMEEFARRASAATVERLLTADQPPVGGDSVAAPEGAAEQAAQVEPSGEGS